MTPGYPPLAQARFAQVVLGLIAIVSSMDAQILLLLIEPVKHDLRLSDVEAGVANTTSYYAAYALLSMPLGILADRLNRVRMTLIAMTIWCVGLGCTTFAAGFWWLFGAKAVMGAASAAVMPAALSLYGDYFAPERRAAATATFSLGQILGGTAAVLVGGLGYSALQRIDPALLLGLSAWRAVFLLCTLTLVPIIVALAVMHEPARREVAERGGGSWRELWAYRGFLLPLFGGVIFLTGLSASILTWIAPALMRLYGQQPGDFAGWYAAVKLASGIGGVLAAARLVEWARSREGTSAIMFPAMVGAIVCAPATCMAIAPNLWLFALGMTVFTFAFAIAIAVPVIAINLRIPNELRGRTTGMYVIFGAVGAASAVPLIAKVSALLGGEMMLGRAMAAVGVPLALLAAICFAFATRSRGQTAA